MNIIQNIVAELKTLNCYSNKQIITINRITKIISNLINEEIIDFCLSNDVNNNQNIITQYLFVTKNYIIVNKSNSNDMNISWINKKDKIINQELKIRDYQLTSFSDPYEYPSKYITSSEISVKICFESQIIIEFIGKYTNCENIAEFYKRNFQKEAKENELHK